MRARDPERADGAWSAGQPGDELGALLGRLLRRGLRRHSARDDDVMQQHDGTRQQHDGTRPGDGHASDGGADGVAPLRELAHGTLRCALRHATRGDGHGGDGATDGETRELLRRVCAVAHERGLHAERVLVALKEAWRELPEARQVVRNQGEATLARVITLCIDEYYAENRTRLGPGPGGGNSFRR